MSKNIVKPEGPQMTSQHGASRCILDKQRTFTIISHWILLRIRNTVEPLITDTAGEFKFCPLYEVYVSWSSSSSYGGDSGNRIFVLYWRCSLIRVSVIRSSTVFQTKVAEKIKTHVLFCTTFLRKSCLL
jgi:hypothetical protein